MKFLVLFLSLFIGAVLAHGDGFYKLPFEVYQGDNFFDALRDELENLESLFDRSAEKLPIINERLFYVAKIQIGTPAQNVSVLVDTGSSDLWITGSENPFCNGTIDCERYGTFDKEQSSSYNQNETEFYIKYMDTTYAEGYWATDTVSLTQNLTIENANFAVANASNSSVGVLGIGFEDLETTDEKYTNLPMAMKEQGLIKTNSYSLYLTSAESRYGSILFGGIDHAKYSGELVEINMTTTNNKYYYTEIPLRSLTFKLAPTMNNRPPSAGSSGSATSNSKALPFNTNSKLGFVDTYNANATFDSGTTLSFFPPDLLQTFVARLGVTYSYNSDTEVYNVPCTLRQPGNAVTFGFGLQSIDVPLSQLVLNNGNDPKTGQAICSLGILPSNHLILGDNFLRSCYTFFNLDNKTMSIAQVKYTKDEDIEVVKN